MDVDARQVHEGSLGSSMLSKALQLATQAHEGQWREDGSAYISHPLAVWAELSWAGIVDVRSGAAALLHDVLEERPEQAAHWYARIQQEVDPVVADCVLHWLTDPQGTTSLERRAGQLSRFACPQVPAAVCFVKLADRVANLQSPSPQWHLAKRQVYARHRRELLAIMRVIDVALKRRMESILAQPLWGG